MNSIPLATPNLGAAESHEVRTALESGFVSSVGQAVEAFESGFAQRVGARYAVACSSGTAALHVALRVLGVTRGSEVLCADFSFIGSAGPIEYLGAKPVFVDSEQRTWNMDPELVVTELHARARLGRPQPAAVEVVHILGQPADVQPIWAACQEYNVPLVEDAAESLGATWSSGPLAGKHTGTVGEAGCFSFNGNKIVTTGGGGMIVTDDPHVAARARHLTTQAKVPGVGYLHDEVGYNYRLTNLAAALGNAQLGRLDEFVGSKRLIASRYDEAFEGLPLTLPPRLAGFESTYWLYSVLCSNEVERDALLAALDSAGIGARALWRPLSDQPPFADAHRLGTGHIARDLFERGVSLPSSTHLTEIEQHKVQQVVVNHFHAA